ncbi:RibD family protein [Lyngbya sp. PCC 8106]|uniref:RibD family protein n=1 Tax=Lyngbya sp. (strain PCC 8106) TaxID=313612 RepID=UPI0000EAA3D1|nr:RibD family protein [Lyngbya sp. PCC 8106]EAW37814.1 bifunctional deaminase-reductase-like protein [Lyngbya sp. PCC 8106]
MNNINFPNLLNRPHTTVILAMSADGKIADKNRSPARFGSPTDTTHLETQIADADGVLFGRGTLDTYGTTLSVSSEELLQRRQQQEKSPQPIQIVCSSSGKINPNLRFFQQSVPRWLLTTSQGSEQVKRENLHLTNLPDKSADFQQILIAKTLSENSNLIDWNDAFQQFMQMGLKRLAVLGGGQLVGSLIQMDLIDEFWLTVCPLILGGVDAPTPVEGKGFLADVSPRLQLLEVKQVEQEIFIHYQVDRKQKA